MCPRICVHIAIKSSTRKTSAARIANVFISYECIPATYLLHAKNQGKHRSCTTTVIVKISTLGAQEFAALAPEIDSKPTETHEHEADIATRRLQKCKALQFEPLAKKNALKKLIFST